MSHMKKFIVKAGLLGALIYGGYSWVNQTPAHADNVSKQTAQFIQNAEVKAEAALEATENLVGGATEKVSNSWETADLGGKYDAAQDNAKPIGDAIRKTVNPSQIPGVKSVNWAERNTSFAAIFFMLIGAATLLMLAGSGPSSLSGGRE